MADVKSAAAEGGKKSGSFGVGSNGLKHGASIAEKKRLRKARRRTIGDNAANAAESYAQTMRLTETAYEVCHQLPECLSTPAMVEHSCAGLYG